MPTIVSNSSSKNKMLSIKASSIILIVVILIVAISVYFSSGANSRPIFAANVTQTVDECNDVQLDTGGFLTDKDSASDDNLSKASKPVHISRSSQTNDAGVDIKHGESSSKTSIIDERMSSSVPHRVMPQPKTHFDNPVDNQLERLSVAGRGVRSTPLPTRLTQELIIEYLRRPIEVNDDDDDETVAAKERTAELKAEALRYIEEGGTYDEFVRQMVKLSNDEADMIRDARMEMFRLLREEGALTAVEYIKTVNTILIENGLKEIPITAALSKRAEEEARAIK